MPTIQVTNRKASPALRGQSIRVHLDGTESLADLPQIQVGQSAVIDGTSKTCKVSEVDTYGTSFLLTPILATDYLESTANTGVFAVSATATITV